MKRVLAGLATLMLVTACAVAIASGVPVRDKKVSIKGEIVDTGCYMARGAHGEKHKECAVKCASNGMPIAILTDKGKLVLLTPNHDDADAFDKAKELAGANVEVSGMLMEKGGITAIDITSIKEITAATK
jgi:hypothetical protein